MKPKMILLSSALIIASASVQGQGRKDSIQIRTNKNVKTTPMKPQIPGSLREEHKELHETLQKFTFMSGKTGAAARETAKALHPHFVKEEEIALPQLGLLPALAKGKAISDTSGVIAKSEALKRDFDEMLSEHQHIVVLLDKLYAVAKEENHPEVMHFTEALKQHAKTEEEVLYPTAILIGEYLKIKDAVVVH